MRNKFWLVTVISLLLSLVFVNNVFAQSTLSGTFEGEKISVMFSRNNSLFIFLKGNPLTSATFTVSGSTITLREKDNIVDTWTIIDVDTIRGMGGDLLKRIKSVSGRFYGQSTSSTSFEFEGNNFSGIFGSTSIFWGTFTVSSFDLNMHITGGVDGETSQFLTFTIIDSNTIMDTDGNLYRRR